MTRIGSLEFKDFENVMTDIWNQFISNCLEYYFDNENQSTLHHSCETAKNIKHIPKHIATVLSFNPFIAPPPPGTSATLLHLPDGSTIDSGDEQFLAQIRREAEEYAAKEKLHNISELHRLIDEASDLVCWSIFSKVGTLTIYEKFGIFSEQDISQFVAIARDKLVLMSQNRAPQFMSMYPTREKFQAMLLSPRPKHLKMMVYFI